jgi:hypothetical protein
LIHPHGSGLLRLSPFIKLDNHIQQGGLLFAWVLSTMNLELFYLYSKRSTHHQPELTDDPQIQSFHAKLFHLT